MRASHFSSMVRVPIMITASDSSHAIIVRPLVTCSQLVRNLLASVNLWVSGTVYALYGPIITKPPDNLMFVLFEIMVPPKCIEETIAQLVPLCTLV